MYHFYRTPLSEARLSDMNTSGYDMGRQVLISMPNKKETANIRFVRLENANAVGQYAALLTQEQLTEKSDAAIVFPTGKTPLPMYAALRSGDKACWAKSRLFQLDEYVPPRGNTSASYETFAQFMNRELWNHVDGQKYYLQDYLDRPLSYEDLVTQGGGPDLVVLGIGGNGHVAFNEPGSPKDSPTRLIDLAEETIRSNFGDAQQDGCPVQAVTLGLKAILSARHIILLATGNSKKEIVEKAFAPGVFPSSDCPASWLKLHPHVTVVTDIKLQFGLD